MLSLILQLKKDGKRKKEREKERGKERRKGGKMERKKESCHKLAMSAQSFGMGIGGMPHISYPFFKDIFFFIFVL